MSDLADLPCTPPGPGGAALDADEAATWLARLGNGWALDAGRLTKGYAFADFAQALAFVNAVGAEAEAAGHHPDIVLRWGRVELRIWTHDVDGLTACDFVLAARCDRRYQPPAG